MCVQFKGQKFNSLSRKAEILQNIFFQNMMATIIEIRKAFNSIVHLKLALYAGMVFYLTIVCFGNPQNML